MTTKDPNTIAVQQPTGTPRYVDRCDYKKEFMLEMEYVALPRISYVLLWIVAAVVLLGLILALSHRNWAQAFYMMFCLGFLIFVRFGLPRLRVKHLLGQMNTMYGGVTKVETLFYDDEIFCHNLSSDAKSKMDYVSVVRIIRTKSLYFIKYKPNLYVIVDRSTFSSSEEEQGFERFLREKAPQAKFQVRK